MFIVIIIITIVIIITNCKVEKEDRICTEKMDAESRGQHKTASVHHHEFPVRT